MSVTEMQLAAIKAIAKLEDEKALLEILEYLAKRSSASESEKVNLSQHYEKIKKQYGNVLLKLAQ
ncbi:MAG: hypothetical protein QM640_17470 [Niabella sp.]